MASKQTNNRAKQTEILVRHLTIDRCSVAFHFSVDERRSLPPERRTLECIEFFATLNEPIKGLKQVRGSIFPEEKVTIGQNVEPSVGSILSLRQYVDIATHVSCREFGWLITLAVGNGLNGAHMAFHKPSYGRALIKSLSFYSQSQPKG